MLRILTENLYQAVKDAYIPKTKQPRADFPILQHVLLTPAEDGLYTAMTDLGDSKIGTSIGRWDGEPFATCVPARALKDWLSITRKYTNLISIEFDSEWEKIIIQAEDARAEFKCISADEFPPV